jgi:tripartite-type tricarboxylate transporter receptor subunit TctC
MVAWALDRMIDTKFHVIVGYSGDAALFLALQQGELQGVGSESYSTLQAHPDWIKRNMVVPLYSIALDRLPQAPSVPTIVELAPNRRDRAVNILLATIPAIGMSVFAPPAVRRDRVLALEQGLAGMERDPAFQLQMRKLHQDPDPLTGSQVTSLVRQAIGADSQVIRDLKSLTSPIH